MTPSPIASPNAVRGPAMPTCISCTSRRQSFEVGRERHQADRARRRTPRRRPGRPCALGEEFVEHLLHRGQAVDLSAGGVGEVLACPSSPKDRPAAAGRAPACPCAAAARSIAAASARRASAARRARSTIDRHRPRRLDDDAGRAAPGRSARPAGEERHAHAAPALRIGRHEAPDQPRQRQQQRRTRGWRRSASMPLDPAPRLRRRRASRVAAAAVGQRQQRRSAEKTVVRRCGRERQATPRHSATPPARAGTPTSAARFRMAEMSRPSAVSSARGPRGDRRCAATGARRRRSRSPRRPRRPRRPATSPARAARTTRPAARRCRAGWRGRPDRLMPRAPSAGRSTRAAAAPDRGRCGSAARGSARCSASALDPRPPLG